MADVVVATATVIKPYNGYVLKQQCIPVRSDITISEGDALFRDWAHALQAEYAPHAVEVRIRLWGTDTVWEY